MRSGVSQKAQLIITAHKHCMSYSPTNCFLSSEHNECEPAFCRRSILKLFKEAHAFTCVLPGVCVWLVCMCWCVCSQSMAGGACLERFCRDCRSLATCRTRWKSQYQMYSCTEERWTTDKHLTVLFNFYVLYHILYKCISIDIVVKYQWSTTYCIMNSNLTLIW